MFSIGFTSLSYFFFFFQWPSSSLYTVFDTFSCNIVEVLSINPSLNAFVFEYFNIHHKDWLTCSGGTDRPGDWPSELCDDLIRLFNVPTRIPDCYSHSPAILDFFSFFSDTSICSTTDFNPLGNSYHVAVSVFIDYSSNSKGFPFSLYSIWLFSCWLGRPSWSFERYAMGGYLSTRYSATVNFASASRLDLMYIFLIVNIRFSLIHLHGFLLVEITFFVCNDRIDFLNLN